MATTGAVTLLDELALSQPRYRAGVLKTLLEQVLLQDRIPYVTTGTKSVSYRFLSGIPSVQLRLLNEAVGLRKAEFTEASETLTIIENDVDIDPVILEDTGPVMNLELAQTEQIIASIGYKINDLFINGNPASDIREPAGLLYRFRNDTRFTGQTINIPTSGTTEHNFIPGSATDANILAYLYALDKTVYLLNNGNNIGNTIGLTNQQMILALNANLRQIKLYDTTRDQFDREFVAYKGVSFLDAGYKDTGAISGVPAAAGNVGDQIIPHDMGAGVAGATEAVGGSLAFSNQNPIYFVRLGENFVTGLQMAPLKVDPIGKTDTSPHYIRTNIQWVMSPIAVYQRRAIARLLGAAVTTTPAP
jgi:hypothetical protein